MKALVVANWKMNPGSFRAACRLFDATKKAALRSSKVSVVVAPPSLYLQGLAARYRGKKVALCAQNAYAEDDAPHTGEVSLAQMKKAGASYVIVGHGERRAMGETDEDARRKVAAALSLRMKPILSVGEKERTRDGAHFQVVREELRAGLAGLRADALSRMYLMYEPLWAVGSGTPVAPRAMHEMTICIKKILVDSFGEAGRRARILYGGSVTERNARAMLEEAGVSGFVVGGASLREETFSALLGALS